MTVGKIGLTTKRSWESVLRPEKVNEGDQSLEIITMCAKTCESMSFLKAKKVFLNLRKYTSEC